MSLKTYFDYIHTLLPDDQWEAYTSCATTGVMRSLTGSGHRPRGKLQSLLESEGRHMSKPGFAVADNHRWINRDNKSVPLGHHWGHLGGRYYIQESAASLPATLIDYQADDVILDMCAAPGGKTSQLASNLLKLGGSGFVVANEIDNLRRNTLKENIERMGLHNVTVAHRHSGWRSDHYPNSFDHIVVDAPCSGEGTIFRTVEFMDDWGIGLTHRNAEIQKQILKDAINCLKAGGTLIYSTCTLNTNENEGVVARVLENFGDQVELVAVDIQGSSPGLSGYGLNDEDCHKVARFWPHVHKSGGFWVSKFIKHGGKYDSKGTRIPLPGNKQSIEQGHSSNKTILSLLTSQRGITLPKHNRIYEYKGYLYLTTTQKLVGYESGLAIFKLGYANNSVPLAPLVPALGHLSSLARVDLDDKQVQEWMMGTELEIKTKLKGWVIVSCHGFDVGLAKVSGGILKNKMKN